MKRLRKVNKEQIAAIKYIIFQSKEIGDLCKRVLAFLIKNSRALREPVMIQLVAGKDGYDRNELKNLYADLNIAKSRSRNIHLTELLKLAGAGVEFDASEGDNDCHCGFWLPDKNVVPKQIIVNRLILSRIDLVCPGLYPVAEQHEKRLRAG